MTDLVLLPLPLSISLSDLDRLSEARPFVCRRVGGGSGRRGDCLGDGGLGARRTLPESGLM